MIKKYWKLVLLTAAAIGFIMILDLCMKNGISEKWMSFLGSFIGGIMTLAGVVMTIEDQHKEEREERRIANMPVLFFDVMNASDTNGDRKLTILENKRLSTSAFIQINGKGCLSKIPHFLMISTNKPAFNLIIDSLAVNGKEVPKDKSFAPMAESFNENHHIELQIDSEISFNNSINSFWLLRFRYEDIFQNEYYQDVPLIYEEIMKDITTEQHIELRDIKAPVLMKDAKPIEEACKKYQDYDVFCKKEEK